MLSSGTLADINHFMEDIKDFISERDIFARHCGIRLLEVKRGEAAVEMEVQDTHLNGLNLAHGGAIFALADLAFAAAANSGDHVAVGINVTISYVRPAEKGEVLTARAREVFSTRSIGGYSVEVENKAGELIAVFQGNAYKKGLKKNIKIKKKE